MKFPEISLSARSVYSRQGLPKIRLRANKVKHYTKWWIRQKSIRILTLNAIIQLSEAAKKKKKSKSHISESVPKICLNPVTINVLLGLMILHKVYWYTLYNNSSNKRGFIRKQRAFYLILKGFNYTLVSNKIFVWTLCIVDLILQYDIPGPDHPSIIFKIRTHSRAAAELTYETYYFGKNFDDR